MATVLFSNVGRNRLQWVKEFPGKLTAAMLYREVKARKALASKGIDFDDDGTITAGGRPVGNWKVIG